VRPFGLHLKFADGAEGVVDLASELGSRLSGPLFDPLRDPEYFSKVTLAEGAPTWPNGVDLAPDVLYHDIAAQGKAMQRAG
jgi:hypothetical protein